MSRMQPEQRTQRLCLPVRLVLPHSAPIHSILFDYVLHYERFKINTSTFNLKETFL